MKTLQRYRLYTTSPVQTLTMPVGAQIMSVESRGNIINLVAMVDQGVAVEERRFAVQSPTASAPSGLMSFLGSVSSNSSQALFNVYELSTLPYH